MVNSRFEYVKQFESEDFLLPDTYIVASVSTRNFDRFAREHSLAQPFDDRLIRLFARAARRVMEDFADIEAAFVMRDGFEFVFARTAALFNRRRDKILTNLVSLLASALCSHWSACFGGAPQKRPLLLAGRIELLPRRRSAVARLVRLQTEEAERCLALYAAAVAQRRGDAPAPLSFAEANEFLFANGINFSFLPARHRRGTLLFRARGIAECSDDLSSTARGGFWNRHKSILR